MKVPFLYLLLIIFIILLLLFLLHLLLLLLLHLFLLNFLLLFLHILIYEVSPLESSWSKGDMSCHILFYHHRSATFYFTCRPYNRVRTRWCHQILVWSVEQTKFAAHQTWCTNSYMYCTSLDTTVTVRYKRVPIDMKMHFSGYLIW